MGRDAVAGMVEGRAGEFWGGGGVRDDEMDFVLTFLRVGVSYGEYEDVPHVCDGGDAVDGS